VLVTGDQVVGPEAEPFCPGIRAVVVKESLSREAALSLHPEVARDLVRTGTTAALQDVGRLEPPAVRGPLEVDVLPADMAVQAACGRGVERAAERTVVIDTSDPLAAYRSFVAVIAITRALGTA
jgi:D-amino peptidase